jgi:hypothetical protein
LSTSAPKTIGLSTEDIRPASSSKTQTVEREGPMANPINAAPTDMPDEPIPDTLRPIISIIELLDKAHSRDPISKTRTEQVKIHFAGYR